MCRRRSVRVAAPGDVLLVLELVQQQDDAVRVEAHGIAELLLGDQSALVEVAEHDEAAQAHAEHLGSMLWRWIVLRQAIARPMSPLREVAQRLP